jgi:hypothetical protein
MQCKRTENSLVYCIKARPIVLGAPCVLNLDGMMHMIPLARLALDYGIKIAFERLTATMRLRSRCLQSIARRLLGFASCHGTMKRWRSVRRREFSELMYTLESRPAVARPRQNRTACSHICFRSSSTVRSGLTSFELSAVCRAWWRIQGYEVDGGLGYRRCWSRRSDFVSDDRMQSGVQDTGQLNFLPARYLHGGD